MYIVKYDEMQFLLIRRSLSRHILIHSQVYHLSLSLCLSIQNTRRTSPPPPPTLRTCCRATRPTLAEATGASSTPHPPLLVRVRVRVVWEICPGPQPSLRQTTLKPCEPGEDDKCVMTTLTSRHCQEHIWPPSDQAPVSPGAYGQPQRQKVTSVIN